MSINMPASRFSAYPTQRVQGAASGSSTLRFSGRPAPPTEPTVTEQMLHTVIANQWALAQQIGNINNQVVSARESARQDVDYVLNQVADVLDTVKMVSNDLDTTNQTCEKTNQVVLDVDKRTAEMLEIQANMARRQASPFQQNEQLQPPETPPHSRLNRQV